MNGYFQIQIKDNGVSVLLVPPMGNGEKIRVAELKEYLDRIGVPYDVMSINSALYTLSEEEVVLFLSPIKLQPVAERCSVQVTSNRMQAIMRMYPPSNGGTKLDKTQIMEALSNANVKKV